MEQITKDMARGVLVEVYDFVLWTRTLVERRDGSVISERAASRSVQSCWDPAAGSQVERTDSATSSRHVNW